MRGADYFEMIQKSKKLYHQAMEPVCSRWQITKNELDVLIFLYNNPEFNRAADIVARRGLTKSHVSMSLTNLHSRGLVEARADERDRRALRLSLTGTGREIAAQGRTIQDQFFRTIFAGLSREDLGFWHAMVDRVCDNINHMEG